jgi:hypothetical protein
MAKAIAAAVRHRLRVGDFPAAFDVMGRRRPWFVLEGGGREKRPPLRVGWLDTGEAGGADPALLLGLRFA